MSDSNERTCYVGNLAPDLTDELIKELFVQVGPVEKVIVRNNDSRKYALIVFEDEESVPFAIETLDNVRLFDVSISVKPRKGSRQEIAYKKKYDRVRKEEIDKRRSCPDIPGMYQNDSSLGFNPMAQIASFANGLPPPPPPPFCTPPMSRKMDYKISNSAPRDNWHTPPDRGDYDYRNNRSGDKYSDYSSSRRNNGKLTFPSKNERSDRSRERYNDGGRDYDRRDTREYRDNRDRSQRRGYDGRRW